MFIYWLMAGLTFKGKCPTIRPFVGKPLEEMYHEELNVGVYVGGSRVGKR